MNFQLIQRILLAFACLVYSEVRGDIIAAWDVAGLNVADDLSALDNYAFAATTTDANVNASLTLGSGGGLTPSDGDDRYGFRVAGGASGNTQTSLAGAVANDHFFQWSVTIAPGFELDLTSLAFFGAVTGTGADDVAVLTSIDGFSAGNEIASLTGRRAEGSDGLDTDASGFGAPIDLSAAQYQGLTGTVSFRLYGYNTTSGSGSTYIRDAPVTQGPNDLIVNGTISAMAAVPEPSSFAVLGAIGGVWFYRRRRVR